eukprot:jgi/Botrbrau1/13742/Bobra.0356s0018.1
MSIEHSSGTEAIVQGQTCDRLHEPETCQFVRIGCLLARFGLACLGLFSNKRLSVKFLHAHPVLIINARVQRGEKLVDGHHAIPYHSPNIRSEIFLSRDSYMVAVIFRYRYIAVIFKDD